MDYDQLEKMRACAEVGATLDRCLDNHDIVCKHCPVRYYNENCLNCAWVCRIWLENEYPKLRAPMILESQKDIKKLLKIKEA